MDTMEEGRVMHAGRTVRAAAALVGLLALSGAASAAELDADFRKMLPYRIGDSRDAMSDLEGRVRSAKRADYPSVERQLLALIESREATRDCRDWACRQLVIVGCSRSVPPLAAILKDSEHAHVARLALQTIGGPEALEALRSALDSSRGSVRIGMISSLAALGDTESVRALERLARAPRS